MKLHGKQEWSWRGLERVSKYMEDLKKRVGLCLQKSRKPVLAKVPTLYVLTKKSDAQGLSYSIHSTQYVMGAHGSLHTCPLF